MDFVIAAYSIIWAVFFVYMFYLARRISRLERDIANFKK